MTTVAFNAAMSAFQQKVCLAVVESGPVERCDIESSSLVVGMTMFTVLCKALAKPSMEAFLVRYIVQDVLVVMTVHA